MKKTNEIIIASDHAGFGLKQYIIKSFEKEFVFRDLGPFSDKSVHYPDYAIKVCKIVEKEVAPVIQLESDIYKKKIWSSRRN